MESKSTCVEVFGKRLKELRKANGYTIEQFAVMVGISKSTLGYYENGEEAAAFSAHCSSTLRDVRKRTACGTSLFFYSASVCRLLIITIFLPSPQYLFSVFCRRKSGHLPELP